MTDTPTPSDDTAPQGDSPDGTTAAGDPAATGIEGAQPPDGNANTDTDTADDQDDGGDPAARKARREAAALRKRLRETEAVAVGLREQFDALRQSVVDGIVEEMRYSPALLRDVEVSDLFSEDGSPDKAKIKAAVIEAAKGVNAQPKPRPPSSNPQQGYGGGPPRGSDDWQAAFAQRQR